MAKSKQRQKVGGAVLVMVLVVMLVLIIMLMATLTVVTTAGQRIYTKFEENQAYYTARSALDVFMNNFMTDSAYVAQDDSGNPRQYFSDDPLVAAADMKQGLALQLDLYKIESQNKDGENWSIAENPYASDGIFTSGSYAEQYYAMDDGTNITCMEYEITFPTISDGSNTYGKFVDMHGDDIDGDGVKNDQVAKVKIEVLDRKLAMDTEYTYAEVVNATASTTPTIDQVKASIAAGNRSKDYFKLKLTSSVELLGTEGTAVVIFETNKINAPAASNAINSLGGITGSGAGLVAAGGASSLNTGETLIDASGTAGSVFSVGSIQWNSSGTSALDDGAYVYAKEGIKFTNAQNIVPAGQDSFMYTDGTFDITSSFTAGTTSNPINIIADKFQYNNGITVNGNIFANEFYCSTNGNLTPPNGDNKIYVKDLYFTEDTNRIYITDNKLYCETTDPIVQDLLNRITVYGDIYIYRNGTYENCTTENYQNLSIPEGSGTFDISTKTPVENADGAVELEVKLPVSLASGSTNTITLPTVQSKYSEYFAEDVFDANGDLINKAGTSSVYDVANLMQTTKAAEVAYYEDNNLAVPASPTLNVYAASEVLTGNTINTSGVLNPGYGNITVDTTAGNVTIQLKSGGAYGQKINVIGSNSVSFIMPESPSGVPITYQFDQGFEVTTDYITSVAGQTITNGTTKAPKINYYAGTNANVQMPSNGSALLTGYFYMPRSKMTNSSANNGVSKEYEYNGTTTSKNYFIIGSVTCLEYDTGGSNAGVCYIDPDSGASNPGDPHLSVSAAEYARA